MKKILISLTMLLLAMVVIGCSTESSLEGETKDDTKEDGDVYKVGMSISTLNNPFFNTLYESAEERTKELGHEFIGFDSQDDGAKQLSDIEDLIQQNVDLIIINPTDSDSIVSAVELANEKDIPVITVDRSATGGEIVTQMASDNILGGEMAGEYLVEQLGEGAKVAEIEGIPGTSATNERGEGFHKIADESLDVVTSQTANFNRSDALNVMEDILQTHSDIKGVFAQNDEMALGALEALEAANLVDDIVIIGFDGAEGAFEAIENGKLDATISQQFNVMGKEAVDNGIAHIEGEKIDEVIDLEVELVTKDD